MNNLLLDEWRGCYPSNWKGIIVPEAISHPAKFSSKLIRRIYEHMVAEGWLVAGDTILDPFGGVALGALDAMRLGLRWRGVEIEAKFVDLGKHNIAAWNARFSSMPKWSGDAAIIQGDSRCLAQILAGADGCVSSPPYADCGAQNQGGQQRGGAKHLEQRGDHYGSTPGQLGAMKSGDFDAAVSSPPYLPKDDRKVPWGTTIGKSLSDIDEERGYKRDESFRGSYSLNPANLGNPTGSDQASFWLAARQIVDQVYQVLAPGAHAVWVLKDFIKAGKRVPFCDQWRQLCEAVGFVTLHEHHAMLVRHKGTSLTLEGEKVEHVTEYKSFFRRRAERKGSPRINWETVLCMEKRVSAANPPLFTA